MKKLQVLTSILFFSLVLILTTFVIAEESVIEVANLDSEVVSNADIEKTIEEVTQVTTKEAKDRAVKTIGVTQLSRGHGWINADSDGYLISAIWAIQKFVVMVNDTNQTIERGHGRLHVGGEKFKLVRNADETSTDTLTFNVIAGDSDKELTPESVNDAAIGTFTLNRGAEYTHFTNWRGKLIMNEGTLTGEWGVLFSSESREVQTTRKAANIENQQEKNKVRPSVVGKTTGNENGEKKGFWKRLAFWRQD